MKRYVEAITVVIVLIVVGVILLVSHHSTSPTKTVAGTGCSSQQFSVGSSGACVQDIQTMVNFMETDDLTECPFIGGKSIPMNGTFDTDTEQQVTVVQTWENCYNKQEDLPATLTANGIVNAQTWTELCSYGYTFPKQSTTSPSPYFKSTLTAGQNAGCS
jgi:hypothetical protein